MFDRLKNLEIPDRKTALRFIASVLWIGVFSGIVHTMEKMGLVDYTVVISSFIGVGIVALICGILLYKFVYKKLNNSMMGGFI